MYDRDRGQQSIASFITQNKRIDEENDEDADTVADEFHKKLRRDSDVWKFIKILKKFIFHAHLVKISIPFAY